eukprot:comp21629_c0_seq1/m.30367 comp21629_c0_seq1/g.30367  ORF comp21629_c0_seq1/g.30367 comp21629_c0_seq1/m.30367 type:complete len:305 (-) comp21629_c0_seq1:304-1218(-)
MEFVLAVLRLYAQGLRDALSWHAPMRLLWTNEAARHTVFKCFVLNGIIFIGFLAFFNTFLKSFLVYSISFIHPSTTENLDVHVETAASIFQFTYYVLWVYPVYCISFILNSIWYQDIATIAHKALDSGATPRQQSRPTSVVQAISTQIADLVYTLSLELLLALQVMATNVLPAIGPPLSFFLMSWLYALYCFEYKWMNAHWPVERRLEFIETRWPYFAGFGMPFACCTFFFPAFVNGGVFAMLYPMYIIMATRARVEVEEAQPRAVIGRLAVFALATALTDGAIRMFGLAGRRTARARQKSSSD